MRTRGPCLHIRDDDLPNVEAKVLSKVVQILGLRVTCSVPVGERGWILQQVAE
jgi:hypothetical protein